MRFYSNSDHQKFNFRKKFLKGFLAGKSLSEKPEKGASKFAKRSQHGNANFSKKESQIAEKTQTIQKVLVFWCHFFCEN